MRRIGPGSPEPLGVTLVPGGVNVAVSSAHASSIEFCLFDSRGEHEQARVALAARTGDVFHAFVADVPAGARYGLRAHGRFDPRNGHRFNAAKLLIDPYARALDRRVAYDPSLSGSDGDDTAPDPRDSAAVVAKAIVTAAPPRAEPLRPAVPWSDTIVYELNVRGFTKTHSGVPPMLRGTLAGLAHPAAIAHLTRLGVTTIELMPIVAAIDERHLGPLGLTNYWRYNPIAWLAPEPLFAPGGIAEFAACVRALHAAGLEVIQDIVLNHSGEGDAPGPTLSLRGLDNASYYRLVATDAASYVDDTGCGNTLALDHPFMLRLALDSLRHFAQAAGVDGFRFDLATTLGRGADGFDPAAPLLQAIAQDPVLRELKLIAEPWDVGRDGYRLGAFPAPWGEWNDRSRDAVRRFWRGDGGMLGELATRLSGSSDVLAARARPPSRSINYVTAHDGFTLADLVSYAGKHNEANGEQNRDGDDNNHSWNHGVEGPTDDAAIAAARQRDARSLLATLLAARGTPMLSMGDELGRTQRGNNNAYAQDNPLAWVDWDHGDDTLTDFVAALCAVRHAHPALRADRFLTGAPIDASGIPDVEWRLPDGRPLSGTDWSDPAHQALAAVFYTPATETCDADRVLVALNAGDMPSVLRLPDSRAGCAWRCYVDTALPAGRPIGARAGEPENTSIAARSVIIAAEEPTIAWKPRRSGVEPAVLARLASAAGIAAEWWDVGGSRHDVSPDTKRALLDAMGLGATSTEDARARLVEIAEGGGRGPLPATLITTEGTPGTIELTLDAATGGAKHWLHIAHEDGTRADYPIDTAALPARTLTGADGRQRIRRNVALPALPCGAHQLFLDDDCDHVSTLIVAPPRCHTPDDVAAGARRFGLAAHLYALRRPDDQGIGDFTTLAEAVRATARAGGTLLGLNPLHALFSVDRDRASPYHPSDRRFVDPIYIDVERVTDFESSREARAVLSANRRALAALTARDEVDYGAVWQAKRAVLDACFATFLRRPDDDSLAVEFAAFVNEGGAALRNFAAFETIAAAHPRLPWQRWPAALRSPGAPHVAEFALQHPRDVRFACYLQWQADRQLHAVAGQARAAGLVHGLYRDLAVGTAADGAEAWSNADGLALGVSIGAPPDPFSPAGQVWDLPPAIPHRLAASAYACFRELLAANMRHAGALRIDHVMGLSRLFWVPDGGRAGDGAYVAYPFDDLLAVLALESRRARCVIVGEDLGTVPDGLRERLAAADVLSYRVLWFERDRDGFRAPERYPAKSAACVATHDLPTIAGWWSGADIDEKTSLGLLSADAALAERAARAADRQSLVRALARESRPGDPHLDAAAPHDAAITAAVHRYVAATPSEFVLFQADDLAGETVAQNLPGTDRERPNWRRRTSVVAARLWDTRTGRLTMAACASRSATPPPDEPA